LFYINFDTTKVQ